MRLQGIMKGAVLMAAALLLSGQTSRSNWDSVVVETELGHRIGNPDASVKLVEFISYTCPHCAEFARQGDAPMKLAYLVPGKVSVEVRHLIRDPIDLTVGMLVTCGAPAKFPGNHNAFILNQSDWIAPLTRPTQAQVARWTTTGAAGRRNIAGDFGFYPIMERRGYSRTEVDRCLADQAMATRLAETSAREWERPGVDGTPAFAINGTVLAGVHSWAALDQRLKDLL